MELKLEQTTQNTNNLLSHRHFEIYGDIDLANNKVHRQTRHQDKLDLYYLNNGNVLKVFNPTPEVKKPELAKAAFIRNALILSHLYSLYYKTNPTRDHKRETPLIPALLSQGLYNDKLAYIESFVPFVLGASTAEEALNTKDGTYLLHKVFFKSLFQGLALLEEENVFQFDFNPGNLSFPVAPRGVPIVSFLDFGAAYSTSTASLYGNFTYTHDKARQTSFQSLAEFSPKRSAFSLLNIDQASAIYQNIAPYIELIQSFPEQDITFAKANEQIQALV